MIDDVIKRFNQIVLPNNNEADMPEWRTSEVLNKFDINTLDKQETAHKLNSSGLRQYMIIPETKTLVIDGTDYKIQSFFNIKNAMAGDYKTLDYIFNSKGFNIDEFEIKDFVKGTNENYNIPF